MAHILVAEDDATTREMIGGILKKQGYLVSYASDGMRALSALKKRKFELLLLDIWMPKMSGLGLIGTLHGEKHIPKIIVMTSDKTSDTVLRSLRGQVYQFLSKPFEANT
ncbi:MAG TPA: response regulator, partial [Candidatus Acidoferrum sp.]|nr:response regulator [Candidatus Acidoferrum sp.]